MEIKEGDFPRCIPEPIGYDQSKPLSVEDSVKLDIENRMISYFRGPSEYSHPDTFIPKKFPVVIYISQAVQDYTPHRLEIQQEDIADIIGMKFGKLQILNTYVTKKENDISCLPLLAKAMLGMMNADLAVFAKGWESSKKCRCEHFIAQEFGIPTFEF